MKDSIRNSWIVLPLSFAILIYAIYGIASFDSDTTAVQWIAGAAAITCFLLLIFQSVKGLMQDMTHHENLPEE